MWAALRREARTATLLCLFPSTRNGHTLAFEARFFRPRGWEASIVPGLHRDHRTIQPYRLPWHKLPAPLGVTTRSFHIHEQVADRLRVFRAKATLPPSPQARL